MFAVSDTYEARSCNHCCSGAALIITCYECVSVALVMQHAMLMRHIVICGLSALQYFSTLFHKRHNYRKTFLAVKCVF
jgi:hypothetical protein